MFNPIALVALVPLDIDGRHYEVGDRLQVSAVRYGALLIMGKAKLAQPVPGINLDDVDAPTPRRRGRPRNTDPDRPKRTYRRRDMQAEP